MFWTRPRWLARTVHACTQCCSAFDTPASDDTASGTSESSTGRTIGGSRWSPARCSIEPTSASRSKNGCFAEPCSSPCDEPGGLSGARSVVTASFAAAIPVTSSRTSVSIVARSEAASVAAPAARRADETERRRVARARSSSADAETPAPPLRGSSLLKSAVAISSSWC